MDKRKIGEMAMALLSPKVYGEYRKERRTEEQAASKNEAALFRMLLQDRLATDRGEKIEEARHANRMEYGNLYGVGAEQRREEEKAAQESEDEFQSWYRGVATKAGLNPNPDDPRHFYDYRQAYKDGVRRPDFFGHWPSKYKRPGHPREVIDGVNTRTGERVGNEPKATTIYNPDTKERLVLKDGKWEKI